MQENDNIQALKVDVICAGMRFADFKHAREEVVKIELLDEPNSPERNQDSQTVSPIPVAKLLKGIEKSYEKGKYLLDE
jgi:hypothetical protein